ncbi:hypothetical protein GCM10010329_11180 [Streptomyces spiroverticillatus]|nr:hypothetical protein GCM10010329_11180 [Streptomyces spiroverticillatus]
MSVVIRAPSVGVHTPFGGALGRRTRTARWRTSTVASGSDIGQSPDRNLSGVSRQPGVGQNLRALCMGNAEIPVWTKEFKCR